MRGGKGFGGKEDTERQTQILSERVIERGREGVWWVMERVYFVFLERCRDRRL